MSNYKQKRKRHVQTVPYYQWKRSSLLPFCVSLVMWFVILEFEITSQINLSISLTTLTFGVWVFSAWFMCPRADAQVYSLDPYLPCFR